MSKVPFVISKLFEIAVLVERVHPPLAPLKITFQKLKPPEFIVSTADAEVNVTVELADVNVPLFAQEPDTVNVAAPVAVIVPLAFI